MKRENEQRRQKKWHQCRSRRRFQVQNGSLPLQWGQEARRGWHCCLYCHLWHPLVLHDPRFVLLSFLPLRFDFATRINKIIVWLLWKLLDSKGLGKYMESMTLITYPIFHLIRTALYWIENFTTLYIGLGFRENCDIYPINIIEAIWTQWFAFCYHLEIVSQKRRRKL